MFQLFSRRWVPLKVWKSSAYKHWENAKESLNARPGCIESPARVIKQLRPVLSTLLQSWLCVPLNHDYGRRLKTQPKTSKWYQFGGWPRPWSSEASFLSLAATFTPPFARIAIRSSKARMRRLTDWFMWDLCFTSWEFRAVIVSTAFFHLHQGYWAQHQGKEIGNGQGVLQHVFFELFYKNSTSWACLDLGESGSDLGDGGAGGSSRHGRRILAREAFRLSHLLMGDSMSSRISMAGSSAGGGAGSWRTFFLSFSPLFSFFFPFPIFPILSFSFRRHGFRSPSKRVEGGEGDGSGRTGRTGRPPRTRADLGRGQGESHATAFTKASKAMSKSTSHEATPWLRQQSPWLNTVSFQ